MADHHPDSAAIDRVGSRVVQEHFAMTSQGVSAWRTRGVPKNCRAPLALLGIVMGHKMPEMPLPVIPNVG